MNVSASKAATNANLQTVEAKLPPLKERLCKYTYFVTQYKTILLNLLS